MRTRLLPLAIPLMIACASTRASESAARPFAWQRLASVPTPRTEVAAVVDGDGLIVVAGGFAPPDETVTTVEVYDPGADRWVAGPPLPVAVNHAMGASVDGVVYVFGGYASGGNPSNQAFRLDGGSWQALAPMPEARAAGGAGAVAGKIYVAGGVGPSGLATSTLVYDPEPGTWETAPGLLQPREHLGVASSGGRLYVLGGRGGQLFANTEVFDPGTDAWRRLPDMPTPRGGVAAGATQDGFIVVPGGEGNDTDDGTFPEVEAFDVARERWITLPKLPTPRHGLGVVSIGNTLYTLAGGPQAGFAFSGAVEAMDLKELASLRCLGKPPTIVGSPGRNTMTGTDSGDVIASLDGHDVIRAEEGSDVLCGGQGDDTLTGGAGRDRLDGGSGQDRCVESGAPSRRVSCE